MITVYNASFFGNERQMSYIIDQPPFDNVEYVLFTNRPDLASNTIWKCNYINSTYRKTAREIKINPQTYFPESNYWLWIDNCMKIVEDPNLLVQKYLRLHDIVVMPHPERNNIIEEAVAIIDGKPDQAYNVETAVYKYINEGYIPISLYATNVLLRRNTEKIIKFNTSWWNEVNTLSIRDQISFTYCAWKNGIAINTFPGSNFYSELRTIYKPYLPDWNGVKMQ